jgi:hypothetical protein
MKTAILIVLAFLISTTCWATDYYYSDCSGVAHNTGCYDNATLGSCASPGTQANPFCPDPDGDASVEFIGWNLELAEGGADIAAGDTIYMCDDACDGVNSGVCGDTFCAQVVLDETISTTAIGTEANPITITIHPGEVIAISGGATSPSTGITRIVDNLGGGKFHQWFGVDKSIIVEHVKEDFFHINGDPSGWIVDNIEMQYTGSLHTDIHIKDTSPACPTSGAYAFFIKGLTGVLEITNNEIHHICKFPVRCNNSNAAGTSMLFENNTFYNSRTINNDFDCINQTWRGNTIYDTHGFSVEDRSVNIVIEDNDVSCRGTYLVMSSGWCGDAIDINNGDSTGCYGRTKDIIIRRNTVWSAGNHGSFSACSGETCGINLCAIRIRATNETVGVNVPNTGCLANTSEDINILIENNFIFHHWTFTGDAICKGGIGIDTNRDEVTVQNNTLYSTRDGITLDGHDFAGNPVTVAYTVRNNLVVRGERNDPSTRGIEMRIFSNATTSDFDNNNFWSDGLADPVVDNNGVGIGCADETTWDMHLPDDDTNNKDAGTTGASEDFDRESRDASPDIGADELVGALPSTIEGGGLDGATVARLVKVLSERACRTGVGACLEKP